MNKGTLEVIRMYKFLRIKYYIDSALKKMALEGLIFLLIYKLTNSEFWKLFCIIHLLGICLLAFGGFVVCLGVKYFTYTKNQYTNSKALLKLSAEDIVKVFKLDLEIHNELMIFFKNNERMLKTEQNRYNSIRKWHLGFWLKKIFDEYDLIIKEGVFKVDEIEKYIANQRKMLSDLLEIFSDSYEAQQYVEEVFKLFEDKHLEPLRKMCNSNK